MPFSRRLLILAGVGLTVVLALVFVPPLFIDKEAVKQSLVKALGAQPDDIVVGDISAALLPAPHVTLRDVGWRNAANASNQYFLQIRNVEASLAFATLFSAEPQVTRLEMQRPELELEVMSDSKANWNEIFKTGSAASPSAMLSLLPALPETRIENGEIHYVNVKNQRVEKITAINGSMQASEAGGRVDAALTWHAQPAQVHCEYARVDSRAHQGKLSISLNGLDITANGQFALPLNPLVAVFDLQVKSADYLAWHRAVEAETPLVLPSTAAESEAAPTPAVQEPGKLPVELSGRVQINGDKWSLKNMAFSLAGSKAGFSSEFTYTDKAVGTAEIKASRVDVGELVRILLPPSAEEDKEEEDAAAAQRTMLESFKEQMSRQDSGGAEQAAETLLKMNIPKWLEISSSIYVDELDWDGRTARNIVLAADLLGGEFIVSQGDAVLAGDSKLIFNGILRDGFHGITFEGNMEVSGGQFHALADNILADDVWLPEKGFGLFKARANMFIIPTEARFSEARLQVENTKAAGAAIFYFERPLRIVTALGVRDIDFDSIIEHVQGKLPPKSKDTADANEDVPNEFAFTWLRELRARIIAKMRIDQFTLLSRKGETVNFDLETRKQRIGLKNFITQYDNKTIDGELALEAKDELPFFNARLNLTEVDTAVFPHGEREDAENVTKPRGRWSEKPLYFPWFNDFSGDYVLSIHRLVHRGVEMADVTLQGALREGILSISRMQGKIWDGVMQVTGNLSGGNVPGFSIKFALNDVNLAQMLAVDTKWSALTGTVSSSGSLAASGTTYANWVQNAQGAVQVNGKLVGVNGFDLAMIERAVAGVRSVADIVNITRLVLPGGRTEFKTLSGSLNMDAGVIESPGMQVKSALTEGSVDGKVNLNDWTMDTTAKLPLITVDEKEPPVLTLVVKGDMDKPDVTMDTKSLESYVARISAERMLKIKKPQESPPAP